LTYGSAQYGLTPKGDYGENFKNLNIIFKISAEVPLQDLKNEDNTKKTGTNRE
jgi:hypothetical protein